MAIRYRHRTPFATLIVILFAGCASTPARSQVPTETPPPSPVAVATATPSPEASKAFADGYQAFASHDYPRAITSLTAASSNSILADYALYYLAEAQVQQGDLAGASATFQRLRAEYPQSVMTPRGELELAQAMLKLGRNADVLSVTNHLLATTSDQGLQQNARLVQAEALEATGQLKDAYEQAMTIRETYPRGEADSRARGLAYSVLAANPAVSTAPAFNYHKNEASLLLREGLASSAYHQAQQALALAPTPADRAELLWIEAQALKGEPDRETRVLLEYLNVAPRGPDASAVLLNLALVYWRENDRDRARATFAKIPVQFPSSSQSPGAMLRIGRIYEELDDYSAARSEYDRLVQRYPKTEAAEDARFRLPWSLYMTHSYARAADSFAAMHKRAESESERDMFDYWRARSLEKSGDSDGAQAIYARLARSIESNYYPALAARRLPGIHPDFPAASMPDLRVGAPPQTESRDVRFHLDRILALRALRLNDLEAGEFRALESFVPTEHDLRGFILAGLQEAEAWYDAIVVATRLTKNGHLDAPMAEKIRYPRAYWDLFTRTSDERRIDPWLVIALARQESLFNPRATSVSDARGLMQLLPSTADRIAREIGVAPAPNLYDPQTNVMLGTAYLRDLLEMFQHDEFKAVAAYNGGEHAVAEWTRNFPGDDDEWVENIGYRETRDYVKKVIGGRREYLMLYPAASRPTSSEQTVPSSE